MGLLPFHELAEKFKELQQGAGENLGKLRRVAEGLAANLDPKKREHKQVAAAGISGQEGHAQHTTKEGLSSQPVHHRRGRTKELRQAHPIAVVSHTIKRQTSKASAREHPVRDDLQGIRVDAVNSATLATERDEPIAEASVASAAVHAREELGRSTWTFLHMLAAQYPEQPTRQQQRDVKTLMELMTRIYPCKMCADHFKEVLKAHPVQADSGFELAQWMCQVHNVVNRSLNKPLFPCQRVDARPVHSLSTKMDTHLDAQLENLV